MKGREVDSMYGIFIGFLLGALTVLYFMYTKKENTEGSIALSAVTKLRSEMLEQKTLLEANVVSVSNYRQDISSLAEGYDSILKLGEQFKKDCDALDQDAKLAQKELEENKDTCKKLQEKLNGLQETVSHLRPVVKFNGPIPVSVYGQGQKALIPDEPRKNPKSRTAN